MLTHTGKYAVLQRKHPLLLLATALVIVAMQVQDAVDDHVTQFMLVGMTEFTRLPFQNFRAQYQFAQSLGVITGETQDVGGSIFKAEFLVKPTRFRGPDEDKDQRFGTFQFTW